MRGPAERADLRGAGEREDPRGARERADPLGPRGGAVQRGAGEPAGGVVRPVRVLIVDDDAMVRQGLVMMLGTFDELEIVGAVSDGTEVASAVNTFRPEVVLMDIRMPGMDGLTATADLRRRRDAPEVLVLTTFDTDEHVRRAMQVGACGFLLKHEPPADIARAICRAAAGEPMFTSSVLRQVMGLAAAGVEDPARDRARAALEQLTPSERSVAELIADGRTNQDIGGELMMSTPTVKAYMTRIFTKLDLSNRVQVAVLVLRAR
nr:response regulator transcription factor [Actinoplanes toevensis]